MGIDEDSDEDQVKQEVAQILSPMPKANKDKFQQRVLDSSPSVGHGDEMWDPSSCASCEQEDQANLVAAKFRTDLTLVLALQSLALLLAKYGLAKDLIEELKLVMGITIYADQLNKINISEEQLYALKSTLRLDKIREHLLKIKGTLSRNIAFHYRAVNVEDVSSSEGRRRKDA